MNGHTVRGKPCMDKTRLTGRLAFSSTSESNSKPFVKAAVGIVRVNLNALFTLIFSAMSAETATDHAPHVPVMLDEVLAQLLVGQITHQHFFTSFDDWLALAVNAFLRDDDAYMAIMRKYGPRESGRPHPADHFAHAPFRRLVRDVYV